MATRLGTAYVPVDGDWSAFNRKFDQQTRSLPGKSRKVGKAVGIGIASAAAGAIAAGKALYDIGSQFDDAGDKIRIGTGKTGKHLARLQGDFKKVIQDVPADFDSASTAVAQLNSKLDLTGKPLRLMADQMLELSRITGTDLGTNIDAVTRTFGDWGVKVSKQPKVLDEMFRASQKTGISVASLGQQMVKYGAPLRQMGFNFETAAGTLAKFQKEGVNGELVMGSLRIALGKMAKAGVTDASAGLQKITKDIKQAGSTGKANALALEAFGARAGPDMAAAIREGRFDLGKLYAQIKGGKDTVGKASKDTLDFTEKWQMFRNEIAVKLEPVASKVFDTIGKKADQLFKLIDNPHLTTDQKIHKVLDSAGNAISDAMPVIAEHVASAAPRVAQAFVDGFAGADVWGKLVLGGLLLRKMGGLAAFTSLGRRAGTAVAAGEAETAAAGGKGKGGVVPFLGFNPATVVAAATAAFAAIAESKSRHGELFSDAGQFDTQIGSIKKMREQLEHLQGIHAEDAFNRLDSSLDKLDNGHIWGKEQRKQADIAIKAADDTINKYSKFGTPITKAFKDMRRDLAGNWHMIGTDANTTLKRVRTNVESNGALIKQRLGTDTDDARKATAKNFRLAASAIRQAMDSGAIDTKKGSRLIKQYLVDALTSMGLSDAQARAKLKTGTIQTDRNPSGAGNVGSAARGGVFQFGQPGQAGHDTIPARIGGQNVMVAPGEVAAVFNRHQLPIVNERLADMGGLPGLFRKHDKPHFMARGGTVGQPNFGPHPSNVTPGIARLIAVMQSHFPLSVSSTTDHSLMTTSGNKSDHVTGHAVDLAAAPEVMRAASNYVMRSGLFHQLKQGIHNPNLSVNAGQVVPTSYWGPAVWAQHLTHLHLALAGGLAGTGFTGRTPTLRAVKSLLSGGPGALANQALGIQRSAGQGVINRVARQLRSSFDLHAGTSGGGGQYGKARLAQLWVQAGGDPSVANKMAAIALAESGGDPNITNAQGSGATGLWQILGQIVPGDLTDPLVNAKNAVAKYRTQGLGAWEAYTNGDYQQYLARGGLVGKLAAFAGGGIPKLKGHPGGKPQHTTRTPGAGIAPLKRVLHAPRISNVKELLARFKDIGLPDKLHSRLVELSKDSGMFADFADRAGQLNVTDADGKVTQYGTVRGSNQAQWLSAQLAALFEWRNKLIRALEIIDSRKEQTDKLMTVGHASVDADTQKLRTLKDGRKRLQHALTVAEKHPHKNKDQIRTLKHQIAGIDKQLAPIERHRGQLTDKVIPGLGDTMKRLNSAHGDAKGDLVEVQGVGSPMDIRKKLPADMGVFGGLLFDVRKDLVDLLTPEPAVTDTDTDTTDTGGDSGDGDLYKQLYEQQKTAYEISQRQYAVFQKLPPFAGVFHQGGVIPGPQGAERTAIVRAGETVTPAGAAPVINVQVIVHDGAIDQRKIETIVDGVVHREARRGGRILPGAGAVR